MNTHLELVEQDNYRMYAAIKRVRELADKFESEPVNETLSYRLAADRIFTALYFTDVKVDLP